jgi:transposase
MNSHKNAVLTIKQREEIKYLHEVEKISQTELAKRFCTTRRTIYNWLKRTDVHNKSSSPKQHHTVVTPEYESLVLEYRNENEEHGPVRIAAELQYKIKNICPSTVYRIIKKAGLSKRTPVEKHEKKE